MTHLELYKRLQSSITLKLLSAFLIVIVLSLLALFFTLATLNNTQQVQQRLTKQALPLLSVSQNLSKLINEHTLLLERVSIVNADNKSLIMTIEQNEKTIQQRVAKLKKLVRDEFNLEKIETKLTEIITASDRLEILVVEKYPEKNKSVKNASNNVKQSVNIIRREFQRFKITTQNFDANLQKTKVSIEDKLTAINEVTGQYNQYISKEELERLKRNYISSVKKITQQLLQIKNSKLRKKLAIETNALFKQAIERNGFFSYALSLRIINDQITEIIQLNRAKEKEINSLLGQLLDETSRKADRNLNKFDSIIVRNITFVILSMVAMVLLSGATLYFYIIPKITGRLNQLAESTKHVSSGQYDIDINTSGTDEIAEMAQALNGFKQSLIAKEKADQIVKDREIRLKNIIDNAVDGLITMNDKGVIESFNTACETIFGYREEEVIGQNVKILMPASFKDKHDDFLENYHNTGQKKIIGSGQEVKGRKKDGTLFPLDLSVSEVNIPDRKLYSGIVRDITERKLAEDKILRSNVELERFAYVASHDMQEPLRMVASSCELVQRRYHDKIDETGQEFLGYAVDGAKRMQRLIEDILAFSRIENETAEFSEVNITKVLDEILIDLDTLIMEKNAKIISKDLPAITTHPTYFKMLLQNLIQNGIKFNLSPEPLIKIEYQARINHHKFSIIDNGIGIAEKDRDKVFQVFKQLNRKNEFPGSGIGLSMVKKIVELHNGKIWVEDNQNQQEGTTISFKIPYVSSSENQTQ